MHSLQVLDFAAITKMLAEQCETPLGVEVASNLTPLFDDTLVWVEQSKTKEGWHLFQIALPSLVGVKDVRKTLQVVSKGGVGEGSQLAAVGTGLRVLGIARTSIESRRETAPILAKRAGEIPFLPRLVEKLELSLAPDGSVLDTASPALAAARQRKSRAAQRAQERIQSYVSGKTRDLLSDPLYTTRSGRFVIPLKADHRGKIKGIVHDTSASGQTIYLEPDDVVALGNSMREAEAQEKAEEERVLRQLSGLLGEQGEAILRGLEVATELDVVFARVRLGASMDGCLPERRSRPGIGITRGRHPLLAKEIAIPLSLRLGDEASVILITGPNTGGKTISIKTVGLFVAMAQGGLMLPAAEVKLGCFTQIWADIGDEQSLQQSLSTFSGHIKNISQALKGIKAGALVLLDEVGAGTDPSEGAALARALLLEFQSLGAFVLASTHYGELKVLASNQPRFLNASMEFDLKSLAPTYRFMLGTPGSSHALKIAGRYGIPDHVIDQATEGITVQEEDLARMIEKLELTQRQAQKAQSEADKLAARLRQVETEAQRKIDQAEETRLRVRERASKELEEILREIRLEAAEIFESLKKDNSQPNIDRTRQRLKDMNEVGRQFASEMRPAKEPEPTPLQRVSLAKNMTVRIEGLDQTGVILDDPKGKKVFVQVGALRMSVEVRRLRPVGAAETPKVKSVASKLTLAKAQTLGRELHLRHMRAEDAKDELEKFLDSSVLVGAKSVRIVHGKGEGVLRKVTSDILRKHPHVQSFAEADATEGGHGVTIAQIQ